MHFLSLKLFNIQCYELINSEKKNITSIQYLASNL